MCRHAHLSLPATPASVAAARRFSMAALARWEAATSFANTELVVSELVTNAVLHAQSEPLSLTVSQTGGALEIAVYDTSPRLPLLRTAPQDRPEQPVGADRIDAEHDADWVSTDPRAHVREDGADAGGRGLYLVNLLASDWGVATQDIGKAVWAQLPAAPGWLPPAPCQCRPASEHVLTRAKGGSQPVSVTAGDHETAGAALMGMGSLQEHRVASGLLVVAPSEPGFPASSRTPAGGQAQARARTGTASARTLARPVPERPAVLPAAERSGSDSVELALALDEVLQPLIALATAASGDTVSRRQLSALQLLQERGPLAVTQFAAALAMLPSSATRLCDRMVAADLISREGSAHDRRHVLLHLRPEGHHALAESAERRRAALGPVLAGLSARQRQNLLRGLDALTVVLPAKQQGPDARSAG